LNRYRAEKCKKGRKKTAAPHLATLFVFALRCRAGDVGIRRVPAADESPE
jgi:hypothetical protein